MIDIKGLDKASILAALYNNSQPLGMGFLHYSPNLMTKEEAQKFLDKQNYFDYLKGRVMKVSIFGDTLDPRLYDRDNGDGAAEKAINSLRNK